jgi:hypothetical protein
MRVDCDLNILQVSFLLTIIVFSPFTLPYPAAVAGTQSGGWMQRLKDEGKDPASPLFSSSNQPIDKQTTTMPSEIPMTKHGIDRKISVEELEAHCNNDQPWFVVRGEVKNSNNGFTYAPHDII